MHCLPANLESCAFLQYHKLRILKTNKLNLGAEIIRDKSLMITQFQNICFILASNFLTDNIYHITLKEVDTE